LQIGQRRGLGNGLSLITPYRFFVLSRLKPRDTTLSVEEFLTKYAKGYCALLPRK
jgi:hypothetical protein